VFGQPFHPDTESKQLLDTVFKLGGVERIWLQDCRYGVNPLSCFLMSQNMCPKLEQVTCLVAPNSAAFVDGHFGGMYFGTESSFWLNYERQAVCLPQLKRIVYDFSKAQLDDKTFLEICRFYQENKFTIHHHNAHKRTITFLIIKDVF
jgi:hypothetical protein